MKTAHEIVASFTLDHVIDMHDFWEWFDEGEHTQDEANIHETRFLCLLETYVQERDTAEDCELGGQDYLDPDPCFDVVHGDGWHIIDDGLTERKVEIGEKMTTAEFFYRVQISFQGGDSGGNETWHGPYPSLDAAAAAAHESDAEYRLHADEAAQAREDDAIRSFEQQRA